jgi:hypothetical protein
MDDKSLAERSINYMQQRQSTASVGSRRFTQRNHLTAEKMNATADKKDALKNKVDGLADNSPYF